jgi:hypothetical protein
MEPAICLNLTELRQLRSSQPPFDTSYGYGCPEQLQNLSLTSTSCLNKLSNAILFSDLLFRKGRFNEQKNVFRSPMPSPGPQRNLKNIAKFKNLKFGSFSFSTVLLFYCG